MICSDFGYRSSELGLSLAKTHKIKIYHCHPRAGGDSSSIIIPNEYLH